MAEKIEQDIFTKKDKEEIWEQLIKNAKEERELLKNKDDSQLTKRGQLLKEATILLKNLDIQYNRGVGLSATNFSNQNDKKRAYLAVYKYLMKVRTMLVLPKTGGNEITYRFYYETSTGNDPRVFSFDEESLDDIVTAGSEGLLIGGIRKIQSLANDTQNTHLNKNDVYSDLIKTHRDKLKNNLFSKTVEGQDEARGMFMIGGSVYEKYKMPSRVEKFPQFFGKKTIRYPKDTKKSRSWVYFRKYFNMGNFYEAFDKSVTNLINSSRIRSTKRDYNFLEGDMIRHTLRHDTVKGTRTGDTGDIQVKAGRGSSKANLMDYSTLRESLLEAYYILSNYNPKKGKEKIWDTGRKKMLYERFVDPAVKTGQKDANEIIDKLTKEELQQYVSKNN